jgi:hypothetical protein
MNASVDVSLNIEPCPNKLGLGADNVPKNEGVFAARQQRLYKLYPFHLQTSAH